jgi:ubiquitin fusion degradation protein 1
MLFEVINGAKGKSTHAGVLEFTAEEGRCYLPFWVCCYNIKCLNAQIS